jgi:hypothetical protein
MNKGKLFPYTFWEGKKGKRIIQLHKNNKSNTYIIADKTK